MESQNGSESYKAFPMNGGDGPHSYAHNSTHQRRGADVTKDIVKDAILEKLDLQKLLQNSSHNTFSIADLGCSVGPNTFFAVQNIIDSVNLKLESQQQQQQQHHHNHHGLLDSLEFQVFFNDHVGNDFNTLFNNTLFKSLPENKQYYAAAVPGSFHGRLFPESSIHVFNSSYALHWLSKVPKEIVDKNSGAYNKGKIYFTSSEEDKEVAEAYFAQFERDFEKFLNSRALELVPGGIMTLTIFCVPPNSMNMFEACLNIMGNVLVEMANKGLIREEQVDLFNIPIYVATSEEVRELMKKNGNFKFEKSELLCNLFNDDKHVDIMSKHFRAGFEGIFKEHIEKEMVDDFFEEFEKKFALECSFLTDPRYKDLGELFIIKRN